MMKRGLEFIFLTIDQLDTNGTYYWTYKNHYKIVKNEREREETNEGAEMDSKEVIWGPN